MPSSVLEAIREGIWDYEPEDREGAEFNATPALPGSDDKLQILAERIASGLPLWHPSDRRDYEDERWKRGEDERW